MKLSISEIKGFLQSVLLHFFQIFPIKNNKVLFQSYYGESYNDNPRMISEQLDVKKYEVVWAAAKDIHCPQGVRQVNPSSLRYFFDIATAKVWVDNCRKRSWIRKRKKQYYIQTWHGNLGNKRTEKAAEEKLSPQYILRAKHDSEMIDLMISGSDFFTNLIRKYFWYSGEILECGTPRLDTFFHFNESQEQQIRKKLNIPSSCNIVLYAPTFRADHRTECYRMDFERVLDTFESKTGKHWVMLIRLHPNVAYKADFISYNERIINATYYPDLYDLIPISDVIISDYSSLTFEAGLLLKPVFLFVLDLKSYISERGFYIDIREQPYILCQSNDELEEKIVMFNRKKYEDDLKRFNNALGIKEQGTASIQIADRIKEITRIE